MDFILFAFYAAKESWAYRYSGASPYSSNLSQAQQCVSDEDFDEGQSESKEESLANCKEPAIVDSANIETEEEETIPS